MLNHSVGKHQGLPDVLIGAGIKVFDAEGDHSWYEGDVEEVKPFFNGGSVSKYLMKLRDYQKYLHLIS